MKYISLIFLLASMFVQGQKSSFFSLGATYSNIVASSDITSVRIHSDYRLGFFAGFGKEYKIAEKVYIQPQLKILQTGGRVSFSSLLQHQKVPQFIRKQAGVQYSLTIYQAEIESNFVYKNSLASLWVGVYPSMIFYGYLSEKKPNKPSSSVPKESKEVKQSHRYLVLKANTGFSFRLSSYFDLIFGYHFNFTNPVEVDYQCVKVGFAQNIFQIGVRYCVGTKRSLKNTK